MASPGKVKKPVARVALCGIDADSARLLTECFRQNDIQTSWVDPAGNQFLREKFEGFVVDLAAESEALLQKVRSSPSNERIVLYGLAQSTREALRYSRYGINAILIPPLDRQTTLKMVRNTRMLLVHEFRRYVRLPVVIPLECKFDGKALYGVSVDVSAGGLSFTTDAKFPMRQRVVADITLPGAAPTSVSGEICWLKPEYREVGLRFDTSDPNRLVVRRWLEDYLEQL